MSNRLGLNGTEERKRLFEIPRPQLPDEYQEHELFRSRIIQQRQSRSIGDLLKDHSVRQGEALPKGRITGPVKFLAKLSDVWNLEYRHLCILLGFEETDLDKVTGLLDGKITLTGRDAKERVGYLLDIRQKLSSLFRNTNNEREWLRQPQEALNGKSPLDLLLEGSMRNLIMVDAFVSHIAGI